MALLTMILRKMVKNKWLVISLFTGMLMTTALVSTMPVYSDAILSRMLIKDLERLQLDTGAPPVTYYSKANFTDANMDRRLDSLRDLDEFMHQTAATGFDLPIREFVTERMTRMMDLEVEGRVIERNRITPTAGILSVSGIEDHVELLDGRLPADKPDAEGVYEVMVTQRTLHKLDSVLGSILKLDDDKQNIHIRVKPVGVFQNEKEDDLFFRDTTLANYNNMLVIHEKVFEEELMNGRKAELSYSSWYFVMDYTHMSVRTAEPFIQMDQLIKSKVYTKVKTYQADFDVPAVQTIERYFERSLQLGKLMWSLNVPVLIMLGFYMFMVSSLTVERQKNEIAVLLSRGAARWQVVASYAVEAVLLCLAALLAGPYIAQVLTRLLGASSGFLQFVQRASLSVHVTAEAFKYAGAAAAVCLVMALLPVIRATRVSIVGRKQQASRQQGSPFWHKSFLDILLLAVSFYGLYTFRERLKNLQNLGLANEDLKIEPLQFVVPALFIVGGGLLLLRLYPLLIRLIYRAGRRWWPPSWYATLIQVGRAGSQYQFLMIFLIITLATGVFSAGAARTINNNMEEQIRYRNGAEFVLSSAWPDDAPPEMPSGMPGGGQNTASTVFGKTKTIHYTEPPFDPFLKLPGVEHAAKVFTKDGADFSTKDSSGKARLMGIDTDDFGNTSWFSNPLLPYPMANYLNLIAGDSRSVLISTTLADQFKVKTGDSLWVSWGEYSPQPFIVYGILPYFPTFNPNPPAGSVTAAEEDEPGNAPMLIVGHLSRLQLQLALEPYQVWLKLKDDATTAGFYEGIESAQLNLTKIVSTREELIRSKNDPFLMALNGILTLGFLISILVTFAGFLLYWILTLKGRTLQNGIMRAMGLSLRQLIGMLALEQLLTSGTAVLIGVFIGTAASRLYVPNFQIAFNPSSLVPPFRVILASGDFARLYLIVGFTLLLGLGILGFLLSRLRIHQALKLGED